MNIIKDNVFAKLTAFALILTVSFAGCKKEDNEEPVPPLTTSYTMQTKDVVGVSGTVTISESSTGSSSSLVVIALTGASAVVHPAHIHVNTAIETGAIAYSLTSVDASGRSTTTLPVSYNTLMNFDGYVNVHLDEATLGTIISQADIGGNALTGTNKIYALNEDSSTGISGTAKFDKRKNGTTLVTIDLSTGGILPAGMYPAQINLGSVETVGQLVSTRTLNPVDGISRTSLTNVRTLDVITVITYDNWLVYDGFITIHDAADSTNVIASGNIGSNE